MLKWTATLDADTVMAALREAINTRGSNYVYGEHFDKAEAGQCLYEVNGGVACIVGFVFDHVGIEREWFGNALGGFYFRSALWERLQDYGLTVTEDAANVLASAQSAQDRDETWGYAYALALETRLGQVERALAQALTDAEPPF